jgi:nitronate monooxygenase
MVVWPALARALCARYGVRAPIVQAPMADAVDWRVAAGAARAGVLGSIPCATLAPDAIAPAAQNFRENAPEGAPLHLNFFTTHDAAAPTAARQERWMEELAPYYKETGATPPSNAELVATNGRALLTRPRARPSRPSDQTL